MSHDARLDSDRPIAALPSAVPAARARRSAPARPSRPRSTRDAPSTRARELLVVGRGRRTQSVINRLEQLRIRARRFSELTEARPVLATVPSVVILVEPLPELQVVDATRELSSEAPLHTVFVVVPEDYSDRRARRIYEAGAVAVFSWPREALVLPAMVSDLLGASPRRGQRGDAALARAVRARLDLADDMKVRARVIGGNIELRGQLGSYWKKARLVDMLSQIPGVTAVRCEGIEIVPVERPDAQLRRSVRAILESVTGAEGHSISVSVEDGVVELSGTIGRHAELGRLISVVGNVEGVRGIHNHVTVSASTDKARGIAIRLSKKIEALCPDARAAVSVFGYIAVIDGHVSTLADKRAIEELARDTPGVGRVVNKLAVTR